MRTVPTKTYYTAMKSLVGRFDREARKLKFEASDVEEYEAWKTKVKAALSDLIGIARMEMCDLLPERLETVQEDGYRREKWLIQTEPDVWMPFYLLLPDDLQPGERRPCMIAAHGHGTAGKLSPAGRTDIPALAERIEAEHTDYGVSFVRRGYIVLCPDARGFGERRESSGQGDEEHVFMSSTCNHLNVMAISMGLSLTGMWTWDLQRLIDYIGTRQDISQDHIGCCGLSGGGLQTLWLAALDERVSCAIVSGYFYGYKDALLKLYNCSCNYVPGLWEHVDMGDVAALIAPRALLIETGDQDPLNGERGVDNVTEQVEITARAYRLTGAGDRFVHHVFAGGHVWNGEQSYDFANRWLSE
ncbi:alpha/beta fold hydrolase [Paenibacillus daejeonensis]|uniref:alpha/beta fold hydrolase n=1 Tax=Paenibacillus daejeonensis TaxID=135193 RepID=UPI0003727128|nr:alpha/beta fold hydrolase [Paenibacillus daejeonensis]